MGALKILVYGMGALLMAGTIVLVVAVANRVNHIPPVSAAASATAIDLPAGARISAIDTSGDRLVVRVALAEGGEELLIFNLTTGAHIATITLLPKSATP